MTHTPGPWTLDKSRMVLGPCFTGELKAICERVRGQTPQQADANARLIAAAPELLEHLQGVTQALHVACLLISDDKARCMALNMVKDARAALAKARGEQ